MEQTVVGKFETICKNEREAGEDLDDVGLYQELKVRTIGRDAWQLPPTRA